MVCFLINLIILALTKFCFTSLGMFSLEGQPGCKWLYIGRKGGITQTWPGQSMPICLGREPVGMNNVHISKRGYNIDKQECDMECPVYSACRYQIRGIAMSPTHGQGMGKRRKSPTS